MVCARGRIQGLDGTFVVIGVYLPPKMTHADLRALNDILRDFILREKTANGNVSFVIGGDMNKKDISLAFEDYDDIQEVDHGPTRGQEKLDLLYTRIHIGTPRYTVV